MLWNILALEKPSQPVNTLLKLKVLELRDQALLNILHHVPHAKTVVFSNVPVFHNTGLAEPVFSHLDVPAAFAPSSVHLLSENGQRLLDPPTPATPPKTAHPAHTAHRL